MNCPYCGGLLTYQDVVCPYCGKKNKEAEAFQREVYDRIEQNALLSRLLINKKKPEVLKQVLFRMVFILIFVNAMILAFAIGISIWVEEGSVRNPSKEGFSGIYATEFDYTEEYHFNKFMEWATYCMRGMDNGEADSVDRGIVDIMITYGYQALHENTGEAREEMYAIQKAYYMGYWGLSEEEVAFLEPDENNEYEDTFPDTEAANKAEDAIMEKVKEAAECK